jgi:hypothetical protein
MHPGSILPSIPGGCVSRIQNSAGSGRRPALNSRTRGPYNALVRVASTFIACFRRSPALDSHVTGLAQGKPANKGWSGPASNQPPPAGRAKIQADCMLRTVDRRAAGGALAIGFAVLGLGLPPAAQDWSAAPPFPPQPELTVSAIRDLITARRP